MKNATIILSIILWNGIAFSQQMAMYSQYYWNDYIINPGFTGVKGSPRIQLGYRNQWSGFKGSPKSLTLGGYTDLKNTNMSVGGVIFSDDHGGAIKQNGIMLNYGYNLRLNSNSGLGFGLAGIINQYGFDGSSVQNINPDAALQTSVNQLSPDFNFGLVYHLKNKFFIGFAVNQLIQSRLKKLNQFNFSENQLIRHYNVSASYQLEFAKSFEAQPYVLFRTTFINSPQVEFGAKLTYNDFLFAGMSYRGKESFIGLLGVNYKSFILAYSYDMNVSAIRNYTNGSHEIMLAYRFNKKNDKTAVIIEKTEKPDNDRDQDGILDDEDACPDVAGSVEGKGCPDTDGDGVYDNIDDCKEKPGPKKNKGCPYPDTDGDGLNDNEDNCPKTQGPISNKGCPIIKEKEKEIVDLAFKNLEFETNSSTIRSSSFSSLDKLVYLLLNNATWNLSLEGHTDNVGDDNLNLEISKNRAEAVQKYLAQKGVELSRIQVKYFGETNPIADNNTAEGRQKNRRVEFKIVFD
jgi:type IX secretion system PorP/SprF family membrane protein